MALTLVENFRAVFYTPFYAAFALNAYEAEGVEVKRVTSMTPAETNQALCSGQADVAWGGPIRLLLDHNQQSDSDLVIFCEVVRRDPFFLLGREPKPAWQLADLLDVRLATVSEVPTPWLCLQHDLRLAGLDPAHVRRMPERSMPENLAALRAGRDRRDAGLSAVCGAGCGDRRGPHLVCRCVPRAHGIYLVVYDATLSRP